MTTATPNPRDLSLIVELRRMASRGASYSYSRFSPALKGGIDGTREEYILESWFVSCGLLWELQLHALRVLAAPKELPYAHHNDSSEILARVVGDDAGMREPFERAVRLVDVAIAPLLREWNQFWHDQLAEARHLFEVDMRLRQDARARDMGIGASSRHR